LVGGSERVGACAAPGGGWRGPTAWCDSSSTSSAPEAWRVYGAWSSKMPPKPRQVPTQQVVQRPVVDGGWGWGGVVSWRRRRQGAGRGPRWPAASAKLTHWLASAQAAVLVARANRQHGHVALGLRQVLLASPAPPKGPWAVAVGVREQGRERSPPPHAVAPQRRARAPKCRARSIAWVQAVLTVAISSLKRRRAERERRG
jgi:hypothetical protein